MAAPAGARQYGNFLMVDDDVMPWLQMTDVTESVIARLQLVTDMACTWVQNFLDRPCSSQEFWERHDGWSGEYIMLKESPVLALVSCNEWQSSGGLIELPESTPENPVDGIQIDYSTGRIMRTFAGYSWPRPFFPGSRNIEITYLAGFNPTPPDLKLGTLELIAHWWRNTQQAARGAVRAGGDTDETSKSPMFAGIPNRVQSLIEPYMRVSLA